MEESRAPQTYCGKTVEEIQAMRMQHGHLFIVEVREEDSAHHAICKEPTLQVLEAVQSIAKTSEVKSAMALYDNCAVCADDDIKRRDVLKLQVAAGIGDKMGALRATAKNV